MNEKVGIFEERLFESEKEKIGLHNEVENLND